MVPCGALNPTMYVIWPSCMLCADAVQAANAPHTGRKLGSGHAQVPPSLRYHQGVHKVPLHSPIEMVAYVQTTYLAGRDKIMFNPNAGGSFYN